jgi:DNA repair exonuclease SbcCD ATPase subunit
MTEKKIEALFHEAVIVSESLEKNLSRFDQSNRNIHRVYTELEKLTSIMKEIALYSASIRKKQAQKFADEIRTQIDRYYEALRHVSLDTTAIESMIERYNQTIQAQAASLEHSAKDIAYTLDEHADTILATAQTLKKRKRGFMWDVMLLGSGMVIGALFLAAYPIAQAATTFHDELLQRDKQIQQLKEHYETNSHMIAFLKKHGITVEPGITDDSWDKEPLRFAPMLLFKDRKVGKVDKINGYRRIIFRK